MRIIVGSRVNTWLMRRPGALDHRLTYVLGLQRLGHEVYWFGHIDWPHLRDDEGRHVRFRDWVVPPWFEAVARVEGIWSHSSLIYGQGEVTRGLPFDAVVEAARQADLLVDIGGRLTLSAIFDRIPCRLYVDLDPGFTHFRQQRGELDRQLENHHHFFTVGTGINQPDSGVPLGGRRWHPIMPPVILERWPARIDAACRRFTSVSSWRPVKFERDGKLDGGKPAAWREMIDLPGLTDQELEVVLMIEPQYTAGVAELEARGWHVVDGYTIDTIEKYRDYLAGSRAEFSVAKASYRDLNTGWFSDRTVRYLACGKPVLLESTGLTGPLAGDRGVLTFRTVAEAVRGIDEINGDYLGHCRAARALAETHFDSDRVLSQMLQIAGGE